MKTTTMVPVSLELLSIFTIIITHGVTGKLENCLELKQAKIDKAFGKEFLSKRIYFPIGQKFEYGPDTVEAFDNFVVSTTTVKTKCFKVSMESGNEVSNLPFNCIRHGDKFSCHLDTKGSNLETYFSLWGHATVVKTDNKSYILVVTCISNKKSSWILLHRNQMITEELKIEILDYIEKLGFDRNQIFGEKFTQRIRFLSMHMEPNCPRTTAANDAIA